MTAITTVLFDLDGTLLDTAPDLIGALHQLSGKKSRVPLDAISEGSVAMLKTAFSEVTETLKTQFFNIYQQNIFKKTQWFPGILSLLQQLEAHPLRWGIVTNKPTILTQDLLAQALRGLPSPHCVVCGDTTLYQKPHPAPLRYACEQLHVDPSECVFIGDAERDIQAGKSAGMKTLIALFGYISDPQQALHWNADGILSHAQDIYPWICAWNHVNP
jgi:phosphoglycolate phosphatase